MLDDRFYFIHPSPSIEALANVGDAKIHHVAASANSLAAPSSSGSKDLIFLESSKGIDLAAIEAAVCFVPVELADSLPDNITVLVCKNPRWSFAKASRLISEPRCFTSNTTLIAPTAKIEPNALLAPNVAIGENVLIGSGTTIGPGCAIWPGVSIGRNCVIGSNVTIKCTIIGDNVKIYSGAVIGEAGFGLAIGPKGADDTPHFGRVIIQDRVTIGSNTCIDRGLFDDTVIGENTKMDNLCHIAHNVQVGAHCVFAGFVGIAGSTIIGQGTQIGGGTNVADHIQIGDRAKLAGHSGVMTNVPEGETWGGFPAKPLKTWLRENVWLSKQAQTRTKK